MFFLPTASFKIAPDQTRQDSRLKTRKDSRLCEKSPCSALSAAMRGPRLRPTNGRLFQQSRRLKTPKRLPAHRLAT